MLNRPALHGLCRSEQLGHATCTAPLPINSLDLEEHIEAEATGLAALDAAELHALRSKLLRYARRRIYDFEEAEDLVQQTFASAIEGRAPFKGAGAIDKWMTGILKHKISDDRSRRHRLPLDGLTKGPDTSALNSTLCAFDEISIRAFLGTESLCPTQALEFCDLWAIVKRQLAELPPTLARVFILYEIHDLDLDQVCDVLEISRGNCWVALHRARKRLRPVLAQHGYGAQAALQS
jgi:RNA polymerase sigma factor (sigma-70 family)